MLSEKEFWLLIGAVLLFLLNWGRDARNRKWDEEDRHSTALEIKKDVEMQAKLLQTELALKQIGDAKDRLENTKKLSVIMAKQDEATKESQNSFSESIII